jgi:outer membrane protein assembly factor BamD
MEEYSDSKYREEAQFLMFKSAVYLADASVDAKKENRYLDALEYYQKFIDKYANSAFLREAESLSKHAQRGLEKIRSAKKVS